jgi:hypothetical protein
MTPRRLLMKKPILILLLALALASQARALSVDEAYASIPHQRTVFDAGASRLSAVQITALQQLFNHSDRGTVLRVEGLGAARMGDVQTGKRVMADYASLASDLTALRMPPELKPVQDLIVQALQDHKRFFTQRLQERQAHAKFDPGFTPDVHQASQRLHRAYGLLMQSFPGEPAINKKAFFDHLCALDFL